MKKFSLLLVFSFLVYRSFLYPQSPVVQQIINSVKQDSLIHFVKELSGAIPTVINGTSQSILSRNKLQPGNALAETYIKQKLQSYGINTTIQSFSSTGKNVIATQVGTEFPNKKYMICAHFDDMPSGTIAPGADDNASGTAAVIEAARIFSQYSFPFTIIYALWDEEEQGLVGSAYYATQAANAGDSILGVINLDMIAYDSNNDGVCNVHNRDVGSSIQLYRKMIEVNSQYDINLSIVSYNPGSTYSDHASFWNKGYGAILLIEDDNDSHQYYHTVNDLLQYFNQPYFTKNTKLALGTLASFALNLNLEIAHTPIASITTPQVISAIASISSGLEIGSGSLSPILYYRIKQYGGSFSQFNIITGTPAESGSYNFLIPQLSLGTTVQYYIAAQDANSNIIKTLPAGGSGFNPPGSTPPPTFYQFYVAETLTALYDEANNINSWTSPGVWNITTAKYVSAPSSFTDSPGGNYSSNATAILKYNNQISFGNMLGAILEFDTQWDIENNWDYGQVQISTNNGTTWIALTGQYTNLGTGTFQPSEPLYDGAQLTWVHEVIDISNYANQPLNLRFYFRSDGYVQNDGWYVDNVSIKVYMSASIQITAMIEGLYDETTMLPDTVTVELRSSSAPYSLVDRRSIVLNSSGQGTGLFSSILEAASYYVVLKHRNSIETWSAEPQSFVNGILSYDFTTAQNKAYGNNMKLKGPKWCIYSGDVDQDGIVNSADMLSIRDNAFNYPTSYLATDLTGDNFVDLIDLVICDNNVFNNISAITPMTINFTKPEVVEATKDE